MLAFAASASHVVARRFLGCQRCSWRGVSYHNTTRMRAGIDAITTALRSAAPRAAGMAQGHTEHSSLMTLAASPGGVGLAPTRNATRPDRRGCVVRFR